MSSNPVNAWDLTFLAASESGFGVQVLPTAAMALQVIDADLGPSSNVGQVRDVKDRPLGRGMRSGYVEGDVNPFDFSLEYSQKGRSAVDGNAVDLVVLKAAGIKHTVSAATNVVLSLVESPVDDGTLVTGQFYKTLGQGTSLHFAERLNGCIVSNIEWTGGQKEVNVKASGQGVSKSFAGRIDSASFASTIITDLTLTASEIRRFGLGSGDIWMQTESEVIDFRGLDYSTGAVSNINRGLAGSSAAAHASKPIYPYLPTGISYASTATPLSEAVASCILGTISPMLIMDWSVALATGIALRPAETSSKYRAGAQAVRHDVKVKIKMALSADRVDLLGYAENRDTLSCTLSQGTGVGKIMTFVMPYCEVTAFKVVSTVNDIAIVDVELRVRDNAAGDNSMTITLT